ncbi:MAG: discoidin domain-containing protein, partial [Thermoguttaceae bacterium]|nr:discoidin domain-containing protein [Thermoguttaceae bacterium]
MKRTIWAAALGCCVGAFGVCGGLGDVASTFAADAADGSSSTQTAALRNLAFDAEVWASSEYDGSYAALAAVDGVVAKALSRSDRGNAWCVRGDKTNGKADFELTWEEPRAVSTVVYYGRTGSAMMEEVFRDYEVYLDDDAAPVASGTFEMIDGPQFVEFEKREVSTVKIRFLNGYEGGMNWGASEIAVFERRPTAEELAASVNP